MSGSENKNGKNFSRVQQLGVADWVLTEISWMIEG